MASSLSCSPMKTMSPCLSYPTATRVTGSTYSQGRVGMVYCNGINKGFAKPGLVIKSSNMPIQPLIKNRRLSKCWSLGGGGGGGAVQSEAVTLETPNVVVSPFIGKHKDPILDDGGSGFGGGQEPPPYYRGGGGDGGGFSMGGRFSWGAFWLFLLFNFVKFFVMKNKEAEERYRIVTGRRKTIRHYLDY